MTRRIKDQSSDDPPLKKQKDLKSIVCQIIQRNDIENTVNSSILSRFRELEKEREIFLKDKSCIDYLNSILINYFVKYIEDKKEKMTINDENDTNKEEIVFNNDTDENKTNGEFKIPNINENDRKNKICDQNNSNKKSEIFDNPPETKSDNIIPQNINQKCDFNDEDEIIEEKQTLDTINKNETNSSNIAHYVNIKNENQNNIENKCLENNKITDKDIKEDEKIMSNIKDLLNRENIKDKERDLRRTKIEEKYRNEEIMQEKKRHVMKNENFFSEKIDDELLKNVFKGIENDLKKYELSKSSIIEVFKNIIKEKNKEIINICKNNKNTMSNNIIVKNMENIIYKNTPEESSQNLNENNTNLQKDNDNTLEIKRIFNDITKERMIELEDINKKIEIENTKRVTEFFEINGKLRKELDEIKNIVENEILDCKKRMKRFEEGKKRWAIKLGEEWKFRYLKEHYKKFQNIQIVDKECNKENLEYYNDNKNLENNKENLRNENVNRFNIEDKNIDNFNDKNKFHELKKCDNNNYSSNSSFLYNESDDFWSFIIKLETEQKERKDSIIKEIEDIFEKLKYLNNNYSSNNDTKNYTKLYQETLKEKYELVKKNDLYTKEIETMYKKLLSKTNESTVKEKNEIYEKIINGINLKQDYCKLKEELEERREAAKYHKIKSMNYKSLAITFEKKYAEAKKFIEKMENEKNTKEEEVKMLEYDVDLHRKLLRCTTCDLRYKDTVILKCGHVFCEVCVDGIVKKRSRMCPTCGVTFFKNDTKKIFL